MAINGALGVGNAIERKDKSTPCRFVECRKGHGPHAQIFSAALNRWVGRGCPTCGDQPEGE
jgi:hypothetical protein